MSNNTRHTEHTFTPSLSTGGGQGGGSVLVIRFSAIGDVAMTVPVVKAAALANPDVHFVFVSRPFAVDFFSDMPQNVECVAMNLKDARYKGVFGLEHVYQDLRRLNPDMVADLHDVLRTKYARLRFRMAGIPVCSIDKHRAGRKALVRQENKMLVQQPTSFEKYAEVFRKLGLKAPLNPPEGREVSNTLADDKTIKSPAPLGMGDTPKEALSLLGKAGKEALGGAIGIAPFAAHKGKTYPTEKMEDVIKNLNISHPDLHIILFGGGKQEIEVFEQWKSTYNNISYAGETCKGFAQEMQLMKTLRCMVSMDSGNMHVASLVGTPVVSIWGATHPFAGFMGWGQSEDDVVQVDLPCRPCSIYGNKPCLRDDYACMNQISPQTIIKKIEKYLKQ